MFKWLLWELWGGGVLVIMSSVFTNAKFQLDSHHFVNSFFSSLVLIQCLPF